MRTGFTLAEVLITLGVIGIVAVLTVPAVVKNYRNRMYVSQLQKVTAQITDAAQSMMNDEHTDDFYETKAGAQNSCFDADGGVCEAGAGYFLNNYLKAIKKNCMDSTDPCVTEYGSSYTNLDGETLSDGFVGEYCIQTINGAAVCALYNTGKSCMSLSVDVNGMAEPNMAGRDIFSLDMHKDGTLSDYNSNCEDGNFGYSSDTCGSNGKSGVITAAGGCYSRLVKSGWVMDY